MADLFSKSQFREAVSELSGTSYFSNTLNESRDAVNFGYWKRKIFLSHSHYDAQYVNMARKFFESLGIEIYVDWADESMPVKTCVETAVKIKQKIAENDFFILLATNNALKSKWCNWEVGIGDTYKLSSNHIAILPLTEDAGNWEGNEYLQVYPYIRGPYSEQNYGDPQYYYIIHPDGSSQSLISWIKNN